MKIPVVLPVVHVHVDDTGALTIDIDGQPYAHDQALSRNDLRATLCAITGERECAVRVEVVESDGTTYADIATPPDEASPRPSREPVVATTSDATSSAPGVTGTGFEPGERVVLAYVLLHGVADAAGRAVVHLPPSVMASRDSAMVLLGLQSRASALVEAAT